MRNLLILMLAVLVVTGASYAQRPQAPVPPKPAPKGPSPYVLKKEYEPKMEELTGRINAASGAANSAKRSIDGKIAQINMLDSAMQNVQAILNSANFQIAMNADSLKETRFSMEALKKQTDDHFRHLEETNSSLSQTVWMLFGVAATIAIILFVVMLNILGKRMNKIETMLHLNEEVLKKTLATGIDKQRKEVTDELQSLESRLGSGSASLKRELTHQIATEKESTTAAIRNLLTKLETIEQANREKPKPDNDPEVFI